MRIRIKRRRGVAVLITTLMVVFLLAIVSLGLMGITYMNMRSAEQGNAIIRTRVAAHSMLYVLGSVASRDIANNRDPLGIKNGTDITSSFEDEGQNMRFTIKGATNEYEQTYLLTCTARYVVRHGTSLSAKEEVKATVTEQLEVKKRFTSDETGTKASAQWRWIEGGA